MLPLLGAKSKTNSLIEPRPSVKGRVGSGAMLNGQRIFYESTDCIHTGAMPAPHVLRLSPRQRECLRLVYNRKSTKEIASELGLAEGTVNTYLAEAVQLLGAKNRRHASEILAELESDTSPDKMQSENVGVSAVAPPPAHPASSGGLHFSDLLPLRTQGADGNDLNVLTRFGWIIAIAVGITAGFGALASGLSVVSNLVSRAAS